MGRRDINGVNKRTEAVACRDEKARERRSARLRDRVRERERERERGEGEWKGRRDKTEGWKQGNELTYQKGGRTELGKYDLLIF